MRCVSVRDDSSLVGNVCGLNLLVSAICTCQIEFKEHVRKANVLRLVSLLAGLHAHVGVGTIYKQFMVPQRVDVHYQRSPNNLDLYVCFPVLLIKKTFHCPAEFFRQLALRRMTAPLDQI